MSQLYGSLSGATHAADHDVLQGILAPDPLSLPSDTTGVTMVQKFDKDLSWKLYALHVALLILLAVHLHEHHEVAFGVGGGFTDLELQAVKRSQDIMIENGWLITGD